MPKIAAANIEQHLRNQDGLILDAAGRLFLGQGYRATDMGGIARTMGLARNSLYRYYRSKDHILVAVVRREMAPYVERIGALQREIENPLDRIDAWIDLQIELAAGPCLTMMGMLGDIPANAQELRGEIAELHRPSALVLDQAVSELLGNTGRDPGLVSTMITSMVRSVAAMAIESASATDAIRELRISVRKILSAG